MLKYQRMENLTADQVPQLSLTTNKVTFQSHKLWLSPIQIIAKPCKYFKYIKKFINSERKHTNPSERIEVIKPTLPIKYSIHKGYLYINKTTTEKKKLTDVFKSNFVSSFSWFFAHKRRRTRGSIHPLSTQKKVTFFLKLVKKKTKFHVERQ